MKTYGRSQPFIQTRKQHGDEIAEDYVELIADLISSKGSAKVADIAKLLGVSHVTVLRTLERLRKKGLLEDRDGILLTEAGAKLAEFSHTRHLFLLKYLITLGVPEEIAAIDVEGMEHHISQVTMEAFQKHLMQLAQA